MHRAAVQGNKKALNNKKEVEAKPFLKWAGGKRRILPALEKFFPEKIDRYFEPFLGGGSVFFYVKQKYNPSLCVISDTNKDLINTYIDVRDNPKLLIRHLQYFKKKNSKDFYYSVREKFNSNKIREIKRSAAFIYLNKTCFNGLYRVNKNNKFNVPYGKFKTPGIFQEETIFAASKLLNNRVVIKHQDYKKILKSTRGGDFVYLDPCYDPLKRTSFANYTPERFGKKERTELFDFIQTLRQGNVKVVLSNNDLPDIRELYASYKVAEINAPRYIGSKVNYRTNIKELVISTNL